MKYLTILNSLLNHPYNRRAKVSAFFRILWWKCNQLFFHFPVIAPFSANTKLICYPNNSYGSFVVYARYPEYHELRFLEQYLKPTDVFFDVGAHIGDFAVLAASVCTKGKVVAFEPTPAILLELHDNLRLNRLNSVTVIEKAVSNTIGHVNFSQESESEVNHISLSRSSNTLNVQSTTLDSVSRQQKLAKLDVLKIDVEGAETLVLAGAQKLLERQAIGVILFEVNQNMSTFGATVSTLCNQLTQHGYSILQFSDHGLIGFNPEKSEVKSTINLLAVSPRRDVQKRISGFLA